MRGIRVLGGDFRPGRTTLDYPSLQLTNRDGASEEIPISSIVKVKIVERERRTTLLDRFSTAAAGGIVGGIAAGAMAGGLTGPAGALIGAAAGGLLAAGQMFVTCRVELAEGRWFVATAHKDTWKSLEAYRRLPPEMRTVSAPQTIDVDSPKQGMLSRNLEAARRLIPKR
jgi:hypothetical protein